MAKGLFAVYRDDTAAPLPPPVAASRSSSGINKPSTRRRDGLASLDSAGRGLGLRHKENVDPFARFGTDKTQGVMGKKALGAKAAVNSCGSKGKGVDGQAFVKPIPKPSANGVCTGSLRTRVIPDDPLFSSSAGDFDLPPSSSSSSSSTEPQVVDIYPSSTASSPRSAVDSGYAGSAKASDSDLDLERAVGLFADESSDGEASVELDEGEANRRARALTESPLAEITQAFTGLGGFSLPSNQLPASPSPSPLHASICPASPPPRPKLPRTRSSPSKTDRAALSAVPPRLMPYSTTQTTRRVKPGQQAAERERPRAAPGARTMRI
ncbi:hypothetical protein JCM8097_002599 [Rhodosporidiobolus ruineniae]